MLKQCLSAQRLWSSVRRFSVGSVTELDVTDAINHIEDQNNIFVLVQEKKRCVPIPVRDRVHDIKALLPALRAGTPFFEDMLQPDANANEELNKISNFLHLTPPMVDAHTTHLAKLITPCPDKPNRSVKVYRTNYAFIGPSMKHPGSREVSIKVNMDDLKIREENKEEFIQLITANQKDPFTSYQKIGFHTLKKARETPIMTKLKDKMLTISGQQCPTRDQNLNMCFYRLSGFIEEAKKLLPITKSFNITRNEVGFICGLSEEEVLLFFEERCTSIELTEEGTIQITGSLSAVSAVIKYLSEMKENIVECQINVPEQYYNYIQFESQEMESILSQYDTYLTPDNVIVGDSDVITQAVSNVTEFIASISTVYLDNEPRYTYFLIDDKFKREMLNMDCETKLSSSGQLTALINKKKIGQLEEFIKMRIEEIKKRTETVTIACTVDISHLADQFGVHLTVDGDNITITGHASAVNDVKMFITVKQTWLKKGQ